MYILASVHLGNSQVESSEYRRPRDLHAAECEGCRRRPVNLLAAAQESRANRFVAAGACQNQHRRPRRSHLSTGHRSYMRLLRMLICRSVNVLASF